MSDHVLCDNRIQALIEELGPTATLSCPGPWRASVGVVGVFKTCYADTPIEALTKLRDKVKPRAPEQVALEAAQEIADRNKQVAEVVFRAVSAIRDVMLKEDAGGDDG